MLRILTTIILLFAPSLFAQSAMTLEDAIELGLKNNYDIRIARNNYRISENNKGLGLAGFLPTLEASGSLVKTDREEEADPAATTTNTDIDNLSAEVTASWTIFDGFSMFINRARFNELAKLGEYQARNHIENAIVAISRAYFNLVQQEQLLEVAREIHDISKSRLEREQVRNELGGASSTDYLNAQVSFNSDQSDLLERQLQVRIAREQLNVLLGQDPITEFAVTTEIAVPELAQGFTGILDVALERNSSLRTFELASTVANRDVASARSSFFPRLAAFASYGYGDQTINSDAGDFAGTDLSTKTTSTTIGLSLSFNIFNGGRDRLNVVNARIEANNQALALRDARNQLVGLVRETYETFQQRMAIVALEEQNIEAARQNLELQRERHQLGVANSLEFRDAQVSFARAQTSLISARYQARISRLEIEQLIGGLEVYLDS